MSFNMDTGISKDEQLQIPTIIDMYSKQESGNVGAPSMANYKKEGLGRLEAQEEWFEELFPMPM